MEIPFRAVLLSWLASDATLGAALNAVVEEAPLRVALPWLALTASASTNWGTKTLAGREIRVARLQPSHIASELGFDLSGRTVKGEMRILRIVARLHHHALHHMADDIAREAVVVRPLAKGHFRRNGAGEIFIRNCLKPVSDMVLQRVAGFDLVARNADIHLHLHSLVIDDGPVGSVASASR